MDRLKVNILGGRDVGKTTIAMHAAAELQWLGVPTALNYGIACMGGEDTAIVDMRIFYGDHSVLTPHAVAEMCRGTLTFLVLRPKDYMWVPPMHSEIDISCDDKLENTLRSGHVRYKSLPGCRASVQYVVRKICERIGHGK